MTAPVRDEDLAAQVRAHVELLRALGDRIQHDAPRGTGGQLDGETGALLAGIGQVVTLGCLLADRLDQADAAPLWVIVGVARWSQVATLAVDLAVPMVSSR